MELKFSGSVMTIISALYEGGLEQFTTKDKCRVFTVGYPSKDVVVYCPNISDKLREAFKSLESKGKCNVVVMEEPNFKESTPEELELILTYITDYFNKELPEASISFQDISNLISINIPSISMKGGADLDLLKATAFLKNQFGLNLSYITVRDASFKIVPDKEVIKTESKITADRGESGSEVISKDDILNLSISLQKINTVEDFINNM